MRWQQRVEISSVDFARDRRRSLAVIIHRALNGAGPGYFCLIAFSFGVSATSPTITPDLPRPV